MPRKARIVLPGYLHHITQRGNNKQVLFHSDHDYIIYLRYIEKLRVQSGVKIYAYCLMKNHVHFIIEPMRFNSLACLFHGANMKYAQYYQNKMKACGHVFQSRFYSCIMEHSHIANGFRYVERNPVRANIVSQAWEYPWSSAGAHLGKTYRWIRIEDARKFIKVSDWKKYLSVDNKEFTKQFRRQTDKNFVMGSRSFVIKIEQNLGRKIRPKPTGRPRKVGTVPTF